MGSAARLLSQAGQQLTILWLHMVPQEAGTIQRDLIEEHQGKAPQERGRKHKMGSPSPVC